MNSQRRTLIFTNGYKISINLYHSLILISLIILTSCLPRAETVAHNDTPQRIVSLVPAVTEILFAIGAGDKVVGVTRYCDYPPEALNRTSAGGFAGATVSIEQIQLLQPDLVMLSVDMHERIVALLDSLNIPSFAVEPRNFSQVFETIEVLGSLTGFESGAEKVISEMKLKLERVEERIRGLEPVSVFWLLWQDPLMSAGANTFISEAVSLAGGRNIFADVNELWPLVSPEQVLVRRPDWIIAGNDLEGFVSFSGSFWQAVPAVREGRIAFVNADIFYRYGPRLADGVEAIAEILHGSARTADCP